MRSAAKKYNTSYKKKIDTDRDTFVPRRAPKEIIQCTGCGAFYHRRHWALTKPPGFSAPLHRHPVYCPACRKIKQRSASGVLHLSGMAQAERGEVLGILRNEESRARDKNPLDRIINFAAAADGWEVETTTEKLAQRLGRSLRRARGGTLAYKWSHNNKFVRVLWEPKATPWECS